MTEDDGQDVESKKAGSEEGGPDDSNFVAVVVVAVNVVAAGAAALNGLEPVVDKADAVAAASFIGIGNAEACGDAGSDSVTLDVAGSVDVTLDDAGNVGLHSACVSKAEAKMTRWCFRRGC